MYWDACLQNTTSEQMEMTTPVFTRKGESSGEAMDMTTPVITKKVGSVCMAFTSSIVLSSLCLVIEHTFNWLESAKVSGFTLVCVRILSIGYTVLKILFNLRLVTCSQMVKISGRCHL